MSRGVSRFFDDLTERCSSFSPPPCSVFVSPLKGSRAGSRRLLRFVIIPRDPVDTPRPRLNSIQPHRGLNVSFSSPRIPIVNHAYQRIRPITSLLHPHFKLFEIELPTRALLFPCQLIQCVLLDPEQGRERVDSSCVK